MMARAPKAGIVHLALLILLASQPASTQDKWKGSIVKEGDVKIIKNPKEPIYMGPLLELEEELSIGGPEAQGQEVFGRMGEFVVDDDGNFYISATRGEDQIRVFSKAGRYLRTIGRHGQGPGEFDGIGPLSYVRATGELVVANLGLRCLSFFNSQGTFLRDLRLQVPNYAVARLDSSGRICAAGGGFEIGKPYYETRIATLTPEGSPASVLARAPAQVKDRIGIGFPNMPWGFDFNDNLIIGLSGAYDVQVFKAGVYGLFMRIRKEFEAIPISDEELRQFKKPEYSSMPFDFAKLHSAFWNLFTSDTGYLFVATWEKTEDGQFIHDVFDREGRLVARMPFKSRGVKISGGKYYALEEDEDGYQYVKRYSVTWKIK
jgi:6-bladed beta-propeller